MWTPVTLNLLNLTYSAILAAFNLIEVRMLAPLRKLLPVLLDSCSFSMLSFVGFTDDLRLVATGGFLDTLVVFFSVRVSCGLAADGTRRTLCRNENRYILPRLALIRLVKFKY